MNRDFVRRKPVTVSEFFAKEMKLSLLLIPFIAAVLLCVLCAAQLKAEDKPFLPGPVRVVSTVPANGDLNESPGKRYNDRRCALKRARNALFPRDGSTRIDHRAERSSKGFRPSRQFPIS
jgi:hypothetical protein